jgi:adenosylmethionine-8-amino-7-oxononanoate aminotransferase
MKTASAPIHIVRGEGALLFDENGTPYIDAISSWWTNLHGHAHPYIAECIYQQAKQLEHVIFAGFTHRPAEQLAQRLVQNYLPDDVTKIFYSDNGSTAVEVAIKIAIQYWKNIDQPRKKIIAFEGAYHGDTFGSMSISERGVFTSPFHEYLFDVEFITPPFAGDEIKSREQLENIASTGDVVAFIYEPLVMGAGGMLMYDAAALEQLLYIAKKHQILCIADEVMTGFYRTGRMFASDFCGIQPDIMCLSKGLTGGTMALGITACSQGIYDAFFSDDKLKAFYHGHSFTANPLACTAALASLDLLEKQSCLQNIKHIVHAHAKFLMELQEYSAFEKIRQTGTILAFDAKSASATEYFHSMREQLYHYFIEQGVILRPLGNTLYIMPPYCITEMELNKVYQAILAYR